MSTKLCVGIDVSKLTLDIAITSDGTNMILESKVSNDEIGFKKIIKKYKAFDKIHVCMEATGVYSHDVRDYFQKKG